MRTFNIPILSIICFAIFSCQNKNYKKIESLIAEWNNKEIVFPDNLIFTRFANDTISFQIPESSHKIIVFVDSVGCTSCKLQLHKWVTFMHEIDSICNKKVPFFFFFQSNNTHEIRHILRSENFTYPVCIDVEDKFNSLNQIPDQMMFQVFLIDESNHVKIIGNPIQNISIKELYKKELTQIENKSSPNTIIQSDSTTYHYDIVSPNKEVSKEITIHNIGENTFYIKGVTTSCDCIRVEYNWDKIESGKKASIIVKYKAEETGEFWRTITLYGNIPNESITLNFVGAT